MQTKSHLSRNYLLNFLWRGTVRRHPSHKFKNLTTSSLTNYLDRAASIAWFNTNKGEELRSKREARQRGRKISIFAPRDQIDKWREQQHQTLLFIPTLRKNVPPYRRIARHQDFQKFKNKAIKGVHRLLSYQYRKLNQVAGTSYFNYYPKSIKNLNRQISDKGSIATHLTLRTLLKSVLLRSNLSITNDSAIVRSQLTPTLVFSNSRAVNHFVALVQTFTKNKQDTRISYKNWLTKNLPSRGIYPCDDVGYSWSSSALPRFNKALSTNFNRSWFWNYFSGAHGLDSSQPLNQLSYSPLNFEIIFCTSSIPELLRKLFLYSHLQTPYLLATSLRTLLYRENIFSRKFSRTTTVDSLKTAVTTNLRLNTRYLSHYVKSRNVVDFSHSPTKCVYRGVGMRNLHLHTYVAQISSRRRVAFLYNNPTLYLKYSLSDTKVHLSLIQNQLNMNKLSSLAAYDQTKSKTKLKPTIFTYKTWAHLYRSHEFLIAQPSGRHYYWNTSEESSNIHSRHSLAQTTFLLNWNENLWENSLFTQTSLQVGRTSSLETTYSVPVSERRLSTLLESWTKTGVQLEACDDFRNNKPSKLQALLHYLNYNLKQKSTLTETKLSRLLLFKIKKHSVSQISTKPLKRISSLVYEPLQHLAQARQTLEYSLLSLSKSSVKKHLMTRYLKLARGIKRQLLFLLSPKLKEKLDSVYSKIAHRQLESKTEELTTDVIQKFKQLKELKNLLKRYWRLIHSNKLLDAKKWLTASFNLNKYQKSWDSSSTDSLLPRKAKQDSDLLTYRKLHSIRGNVFTDEQLFENDDHTENSISLIQKHSYRNFVVRVSAGVLSSDQTYLNLANTTSALETRRAFAARSGSAGCLTQQLLTNLFFLNNSLDNKTLFKYLLVKVAEFANLPNYLLRRNLVEAILHNLETSHFGSRLQLLRSSNISPAPIFNVTIKRRLLKFFTMRKFSIKISFWYFNMLVRFMEYCTGRKVHLQLNPHIENSLTLLDEAQCYLWENQIFSFHKILGPKFFLNESLRIFLLALKNKDPNLLINWIKTMLYRMSFWKYRVLFRYVKHVIKNLFEPKFEFFGLRGFKLQLKGKISVGGNSRTRTLLIRVGRTSNSCFNNKVTHSSTLIYSFTGVMGFNTWIYF